MNDLQPNQCRNKKVDGWKSKSKSKARTAKFQRVLLHSAATSKCHIRTAVHSILPTASTAAQPHRPPRKQPAGELQHQPRRSRAFESRHSSQSEHSLRKIRMIPPSRTRSEVRSQYKFKLDLGASTLDGPPPPWEAQRPPGIELPSRLPASVVDLGCRALDCRHVCTVAVNGPSIGCALPLLFAWISNFTFRLCLGTSAKWMNSIFDCAFFSVYRPLFLLFMQSDFESQLKKFLSACMYVRMNELLPRK